PSAAATREHQQVAELTERMQRRAGAAQNATDSLSVNRDLTARHDALKKVIAGTVSDPSGAGIPGAQVTLLDSRSQQPRAATATDPNGRFKFTDLPEGKYLV